MIVGIDLGTTNSLVAAWHDGHAQLIPNALGSTLTPSAVSLDHDGSVLVGMPARERLSTHPDRSVATFKRVMGTQHLFRLGDRTFRAEELSAIVLRSLKTDAEAYLGQEVRDAVITVPAYFGDAQRKATCAAGRLAGLNVLRLLNEPTAAALAYGLHDADKERRVMVLDLGGGTFDVSVLEMFEGVMEVRATAGDNHLGGEDFVSAIMDGFLADVGATAGVSPRSREMPIHASLRRAAEVAKRALTEADAHELTLQYADRLLRWTLSRGDFERLAAPLLARIRAPVERAIRDAKLSPEDISDLVLAGGATRMPLFRHMVARMFRRFPTASVNPDEVVALGAAVQAGLAARDSALEDRVVTDVAPFSMGIEIASAHHDTVVATGLYLPVIERNSIVPTSRSVTVQTVRDGQRRVDVRIFQGEQRRVEDNVLLGELHTAVPSDVAGKQSIDVRFTHTVSGLLEVETNVISTGAAQRLVIENQPGILSAEEIEKHFAALAHLKVPPRDQMENRVLLARGERLYAERLGDERAQVALWLDRFRMLLDGQDPVQIDELRREFTAWLDANDRSFFR